MQAQIPSANQLLAQIWELIRQKDIQRAVNGCQLMNSSYPDDANGWYAGSFLALQLGGHDHALKSINQALDLQPGNQRWLLHKATCLQTGGHPDQAIAMLKELARSDHQDKTILGELGLLASNLGQYELALEMFLNAIDQNPDEGRLHFNLATVLRFKGDLEGAEAACNKAIELNPQDHDARFLRSGLRKQSSDDNHVEELEATLSTISANPMGEALISYSLDKEYEDMGESEKSFNSLERGAKARRSSLHYKLDEDLDFINPIIEV